MFVVHLSTQKGYKCHHASAEKFYAPIGVTFGEIKSFFNQLYLHGETILDDYEDLFLFDVPLPLKTIFSNIQNTRKTRGT